MRPSQRTPDQLRPITFTRHFTRYAEGSVLVCYGETKVLCNASITEGVPRFLRDANQGWITAEYSMLPRATHQRADREAARGKQAGRTVEIQRLIGRALRAAINLSQLGPYTINIDCDVLQADGGTRTASISGACVALYDAIQCMQSLGIIKTQPFKQFIAGVSVGIHNNTAVLDLDYAEDADAHTDMNIVMTEHNSFVEIQGTAEGKVFDEKDLTDLIALAKTGIQQIIAEQKRSLGF